MSIVRPMLWTVTILLSFELTNQMAQLWGDVDRTGVFEILFLSSLADANRAGHDRDAVR